MKLYVVEERMSDGTWKPRIGLPRKSEAYAKKRMFAVAQDGQFRVVTYTPTPNESGGDSQ